MSNDNDKCQEYQKNMGKRLRKIRKENALSQDDVADALGICTKQYQRYEMEILQFHVRNCQYWKSLFILMCDT